VLTFACAILCSAPTAGTMFDEMRSESSTREGGKSEARCIPRCGDAQVDSARMRRHAAVVNSPVLRIIIQVF